jgi:pyruvate,water dikinase
MIAAAFWPEPVIVRMSDFKSNEYANLVGGARYEPTEENPMIGFRGASRYVSEEFWECFDLECAALKFVRDEMGPANVKIMIPFVHTVSEADGVIEALAENGLKRGVNDLQVMMMCEVPSNALLADEFLDHFDGFSIGSNDLTQLTLGVDRDSALIAEVFDERDPSVLKLLSMASEACQRRGKYLGICGQGPSDHPEFEEWLVAQGIGSISLNPDTVVQTWRRLASTSSASSIDTSGRVLVGGEMPQGLGRQVDRSARRACGIACLDLIVQVCDRDDRRTADHRAFEHSSGQEQAERRRKK